MSNSSLVSYTKISPNKNSPRNHTIDTITIHCVVGQAGVESLGSLFSSSSVGASSNYGIGYDGRIGMYVEEKDRSWCSSNAANDNRAITIECASDTTYPYAINEAVYASLIKLCADICKRNGIKELKWKADKSLIGQPDKQNMTVHRWFANKSCPGDYIYDRLGQIAKEVNSLLNSSDSTEIPSNKVYCVQTGAFKNKAGAESLASDVKKAGFNTYITIVDGLYKVQTGAFVNKDNAIKMAEELKNKGFSTFITTKNTASMPDNKKTIDELAREVIRGDWGVGDERERRLTEAGYDYDAVQARVNQLMS